MKNISVACYYPWLYLRSGAERTILEVIRRSKHQWTIYTNHYDPDGTYPEFASLDVVELSRVSVNRGYFNVAQAVLQLLKQKIPMERHDVLVNHSEGFGDLLLLKNHYKPAICYCHLTLLVANDESVRVRYIRRNPWKFPLLWFFGVSFRVIDRLAWRYYSHIFASGETVQEMIVKGRLARREKIEILHPGVDCQSIKPSQTFEKFYLAFSRLKWWKNVELAIYGFKKFMNRNANASLFKLIVAGQVDEGSKRYYEELLSLSDGSHRIQFIPNPSSEQIRELYTKCYAVLNTTINEPWGIIPLEANPYGKAVIAVNQGGTRESQINGVTGLLEDPAPESFARAMQKLADDETLVRKMGMAARKNVLSCIPHIKTKKCFHNMS